MLMARNLGSFSSFVASFKLSQHVYVHLLRQVAKTMPISSSHSSWIKATPSPAIHDICSRALLRRFSSSPDSQTTGDCTQIDKKKTHVNTKVNFSLPDSDSDSDDDCNSMSAKDADRVKLPPPYDPFSIKPAIEEAEDPKDLQAIFHKMKTGGLTNHAVKMFDGLSKDGLTHEALHLFSQIKDKGHMPDVVAHTAVIEAYADAGQPKEAHKVFLRMLACGVAPNAYTYTVLIKGLANDPKTLGEAKKTMIEMMDQGMRPNAATYTTVFEGFVRERKEDSARELLLQMKEKGFVPDEMAVREALRSKRGHVFRTVINVLFDT